MADKPTQPHLVAREAARRWDTGSTLSLSASGIAPSLLPGIGGISIAIATIAVGWGCLIRRNHLQAKSEPPSIDSVSLDNSLKILHSVVLTFAKSEVDPSLRLCVYVRDQEKPDMLRRITSIVGDDAPTAEPQEFSITVGLVGEVARVGEAGADSLPNNRNLTDYLVSHWSFTREMAATIRQDRRSWYAIPIGAKGAPCIGVLFCDSSTPRYFGSKKSLRRKMLQLSLVSIAEILKSPYIATRK